MTTGRTLTVTTLGMALAAGLPAPIAAAQDSGREQNTRYQERAGNAGQPDRAHEQRATEKSDSAIHLHRSDQLMGKEIKNPSGTTVGTLEDLIVDRGSGHIAFAIVRTGGVLGVGGERFALPYRELSWSQAEDTFLTDMTPEQAESQTRFLPENWSELQTTDWMDAIPGWDSKTRTEHAGPDAEAFRQGRTVGFDGTIQAVRRHDTDADVECVVVEVRTEDGNVREVHMGPSWYVMGREAAPMRGDDISVRGVEHDGKVFAREADVEGTEIVLRGEDGSPAWPVNDGRRAGGSEGERTTHYLLASDLVGAPAAARGFESGEIQSLVIERRSGKVAFLGFDPNENLLGLADTIHVVPWSITSIGPDNTVDLDAEATTLTTAAVMPDDLSKLNSRAGIEPYYRPFNVEPANFGKTRHKAHTGHDGTAKPGTDDARRAGDAWASGSELIETFRNGERTSIRGEVASISYETVIEGAPDACIMTVRTEDGASRKVLIGPRWFVEKQDLGITTGDRVTVEGRAAEYKGMQCIAAWNVRTGDTSVTLWKQDRPVWVN